MIFLAGAGLNLGGAGQKALGVLTTGLFWIAVIIGILLLMFIVLKMKKKRKYKFPTIVQYDLGGGKIGIEKKKAGWFRSKKAFFGLFDYGGERRLELNDKRIIQQGSTQDFHEINHKRGLICYAKPDDPKVLLPIEKSVFINKVQLVTDTTGKVINKVLLDMESIAILIKIAHADFRDTSSKIIQSAEQETLSKFNQFIQQFMPFIMMGVFLVSIIFIIQYSKYSQAEAYKLTQEAIKLSYENAGRAVASTTAPLLLFFRRKWFK